MYLTDSDDGAYSAPRYYRLVQDPGTGRWELPDYGSYGSWEISFGEALRVKTARIDDGRTFSINAGNLPFYELNVGYSSWGKLVQTGGTNPIRSDLFLGRDPGAIGNYDLSATSALQVDHDEYIGLSGGGFFTQSGGQHTVAQTLYLGRNAGSTGSYDLSATSSLQVAHDEFIGHAGNGYFVQSGGSHAVGGTLYLGRDSTGRGSYELTADSTLSVSLDEFIGHTGAGYFTQRGGTHTVGQTLYLGRERSGGSALAGPYPQTQGASTGAYGLFGGSLSASNEFIGYAGEGYFTQWGGNHAATGNVTLAAESGSVGHYSLAGGTFSVGGDIMRGLGDGSVLVDGGTLLPRGTVSAPLTITSGALEAGSGTAPTVTGTVTNGGTLRARSGGLLELANGTFANAGGTIEALDGSWVNVLNSTVSDGTLRTEGTGQVQLSASTVVGATLAGSVGGPVRVVAGSTATLEGVRNTGALDVANNGVATLKGTITNAGTIALRDGREWDGGLGITRWITPTDLVVSGGEVRLEGGGTVDLLDSPMNRIVGTTPTDRLVNVDNTIQGWGSVELPIVNRGSVTASGGLLQFNSEYTQIEGVTNPGGQTLGFAEGLTLAGGRLAGSGTIAGNVSNAGGLVSPGSSAGAIAILGDYTQGPAGALLIEIAGSYAGQFDVLSITGSAALNGALNVTLIDGFTPSLGDTFQILAFGSRIGDFATFDGLALGAGLHFDTIWTETGLSLEAVPEPATLLLIAVGGMLSVRRNVRWGHPRRFARASSEAGGIYRP